MKTHVEYSLSAVQLIIGGYRLSKQGSGAAAGGFIAIAPNSPDVEKEVGNNGFHAYSDTNDDSMIVTITVKRGSYAYKILSQLRAAQKRLRRRGQPTTPLNFRVFEPISGDKTTSQYAIFMTQPNMDFERNVSDAEFQLDLPNPTVVRGPNIEG